MPEWSHHSHEPKVVAESYFTHAPKTDFFARDAIVLNQTVMLHESMKLRLITIHVQHGLAPAYLNQLVPVSDLPGRRRLRSSSTVELFVPSYRLTTIGHRSFPIAAATVWNTSCPCPVITFYCNVSPAAEDIPVSTVISGHHHLTLLTTLPWTS